jgi:hypothetical protein
MPGSNEIPFPKKPGAETPKEPVMVHDYGLSPPVPVTVVHIACQDIEAQGWDPMFVMVAGHVKNPGLIANPNEAPHIPAAFIVFRSRKLRAMDRPMNPVFKVAGAENGAAPKG